MARPRITHLNTEIIFVEALYAQFTNYGSTPCRGRVPMLKQLIFLTTHT